MDHLCYLCFEFVMLSRLFIAALSPAGKGLTSWLLYVMFNCVFVIFSCGILGQVWYLIVSIPDLCHLSYFLKWSTFFWQTKQSPLFEILPCIFFKFSSQYGHTEAYGDTSGEPIKHPRTAFLKIYCRSKAFIFYIVHEPGLFGCKMFPPPPPPQKWSLILQSKTDLKSYSQTMMSQHKILVLIALVSSEGSYQPATFVSREGSDQPVHLHRLVCIFTSFVHKLWEMR